MAASIRYNCSFFKFLFLRAIIEHRESKVIVGHGSKYKSKVSIRLASFWNGVQFFQFRSGRFSIMGSDFSDAVRATR